MAHFMRFIRTHVLQAIIAAVVVLALAVGGVAYAVSNSGGSSNPQAAPTTTAPSTPPPAATKRPKPVRGRLTAMAPGNWTVQTTTGRTMAVVINAKTKFGSKKAPLTSASFAVGNSVVVSGQQTATSISATRITMAPAKAPAAGATTTTTAPSAG